MSHPTLPLLLSSSLLPLLPSTFLPNHFSVTDKSYVVSGEEISREEYPNLLVIATGKASTSMVDSLGSSLSSLGPSESSILCVTKPETKTTSQIPLSCFRILHASHPVPSQSSIDAGREVLNAVSSCKSTLILYLLSGGTSSLCTVPVSPLSIADLQSAVSHLLNSGATITQMNKIRTAIDEYKGGGVARRALDDPGRNRNNLLRTLVVSDVIGDDVRTIGSGPTVITSTYSIPDASDKDGMDGMTPDEIWRSFNGDQDGPIASILRSSSNKKKNSKKNSSPPGGYKHPTIVSRNSDAVDSLRERLEEGGYDVKVIGEGVEGEAVEVGQELVRRALREWEDEKGGKGGEGGEGGEGWRGDGYRDGDGDGVGGERRQKMQKMCVYCWWRNDRHVKFRQDREDWKRGKEYSYVRLCNVAYRGAGDEWDGK